MKRVETRVISGAMYELGRTIQCDDGVANGACNEAALRLDEQTVEIKVLNDRLIETEQALIGLWKAFTPPTTKAQQIGAMDKHNSVIRRIIARKKL